ncbi:MAG: UvrD-helicase domain-containing protein [Pseudomonadota bacterium]
MASPLSDLNPIQQRAVRHTQGPLLVLAGAGSGKTRVITRKIAWLILNDGLAPEQVTAVTFTNKAAREMQARAGALLGPKVAGAVRISTFHKLGLNILRRECSRLGYRSGFSIFDAEDAATVVRELVRRAGGDPKKNAVPMQWRISAWKNDLVSPEQALSSAEEGLDVAAAKLYADYERSLKAYNAFDFDDLIGLPVRLFVEDAGALAAWRERIRYLLVDEYQDTNLAQYRMMQLLVGDAARFTVVGDDDQSIYAWRGARPENLQQLAEDFPSLEVVKLEQNYRSSRRILGAANQLIANNPHLFEKRLWSDHGLGERIRILATNDGDDEALRVVAELVTHQVKMRSRYGDYAILYRSNHQARAFEKGLRHHQVPYKVSGGTSFFERSEVRDVVAYLKLLVNPDDDAAFLRVVNVPRREIGATTIEQLTELATAQRVSLFNAAELPDLDERLRPRQAASLREFVALLREKARVADADPLLAVRELVDEVRYEHWLRETTDDPVRAGRRLENVAELVGSIERIANKHMGEDGEGWSLAEILAHMSLLDMLDNRDEEDGNQVTLTTLHAAKGLEFPFVFLVGMEEGILPHQNSIDGGTIEEERRLAYVGLTRAQRELMISYTRARRRFGETVLTEPSRFLEELPIDELEWEGRTEKPPEEVRQQRGEDALAAIRALLNR